MVIRQIFISPGHNYFGRHQKPAKDFPVHAVDRAECIAGRGLRGDRFFDYKDNYKGQVTFFSEEVFADLRAAFPGVEKSPAVLRRNIIVAGVDLNVLIGQDFAFDGVRFRGASESKPCYWMEQAFCPGAEAWLKNKGGLRAQILTSGWIAVGDSAPTNADVSHSIASP